MLLYHISAPSASPVFFSYFDGFRHLKIGSSSRGEALVSVPVDIKSNNIKDGQNVDVHFDVLVPNDVNKIGLPPKLVESISNDNSRCLAVIDCVGSYDRYRNYGLHEPKGVKILCQGRRAFGAAGRINGGPVVLALIENGASFRLCSKYEDHYYSYVDGVWSVMQKDEYLLKISEKIASENNGDYYIL